MDGLSQISQISARVLQLQSLVSGPPVVAGSSPSSTATAVAGSTSSTAFSDVLAQELAKSSSSSATGTLGANRVPTDLAAYGNGHVPDSALAPVGDTGKKMWAPAAAAMTKLIAAAKADGVTVGITETYRPYDEQVQLAATKGLYSQGGLAAKPGTSEHGWGIAADLQLNGAAQAWMQRNAPSYGFQADVPGESWHWAYHPAG
ncbi:D-alanyl-D-alanine carboxypeptidase family protein [Cellulomonas sp. SG140]|uniref:M15 family metallopeptidase n=1 Tax=Cellulomonas sp. SG140 TaxID=2976536 RepID=UPI0021E884A6|nr:M15 family metallopeptidase [Cellulomonas sp. SG140]